MNEMHLQMVSEWSPSRRITASGVRMNELENAREGDDRAGVAAMSRVKGSGGRVATASSKSKRQKTPRGSYRFVRVTSERTQMSVMDAQTRAPSTSMPRSMSTSAGVARRKLMVALRRRLALSRTFGLPDEEPRAPSLALKVDEVVEVVTDTTLFWT